MKMHCHDNVDQYIYCEMCQYYRAYLSIKFSEHRRELHDISIISEILRLILEDI